jgi:hypothetical protein
MVTLLAQDAHDKGYRSFEEYLEADDDDEIVEAEVIDEEYAEQETNQDNRKRPEAYNW